MDNGLVLVLVMLMLLLKNGLNPYCSGQWSRTMMMATDPTNAQVS